MKQGSAGPRDIFAERLAAHATGLSPAARRVAQFIDQNRMSVLASSAVELAAKTRTSDATVVRTVQALGFTGLPELKQALLDALGNPSTPADDMRRTLSDIGESSAAAVDLVLDAHLDALTHLRNVEKRRQIVAAVTALHPAERIVVFGIGPSAALAGYAAMLLQRTGRPSKTLSATGIMLADQMLDLRPGDALLALAYGRMYREVGAVFGAAQRLGLPVVLVTDTPDGKLARSADVALLVQRGRSARMALHGTTLIGLEALVLGLAAANRDGALATLDQLNELRNAVNGQRVDIG